MSNGPIILWLVIEFGRLYLTPVASEILVTAFLGQSVTLPCKYSSWSPNSNSMCWGKGQCPKSKCSDELLHTNGMTVLSKTSAKYSLQGNIQRGDVSLTILNTNEDDSTVYCCRIEVPGWFNDVKKNIRLQLKRAPPTKSITTLRSTTTPHLTTTTWMTTTEAAVLTTIKTTPDFTTGKSLQPRISTLLTTTATTYPQTPLHPLPETTTDLLITNPSTEGSILTTESEMFFLSSHSQISTEGNSENTASLAPQESEEWVLQSTSQASRWEMSGSVTSPQLRAPENTIFESNEVEVKQMEMTDHFDLLMIIVSCTGFVVFVLLVGFLLRGKVKKTNCFQKHRRLNSIEENKTVLSDIQLGREDEDGMFTL